jgi:hypothetical protein
MIAVTRLKSLLSLVRLRTVSKSAKHQLRGTCTNPGGVLARERCVARRSWIGDGHEWHGKAMGRLASLRRTEVTAGPELPGTDLGLRAEQLDGRTSSKRESLSLRARAR